MNKEPEFKWNDSLIKEFLSENFFSYALNQTLEERLNKFKESKQPKPEWEIITYIYPTEPKPNLISKFHSYWNHCVENNYPIHSVKRLSDNSIWSLGSKFIANAGCELTIKRFDVAETGMQVWSKEFGFWFLEEIKKPRLFTTEDGVDILNGLLHVCSVGRSTFEVSECRADLIQKGHHDHYLYFSCMAKAEEYILMNKPLFSIAEIMSKVVNYSIYKDNYTEVLIKIAKEKLNKP